MAEELELEVATPERELVKDKVSEVQVPARDGYIGILPGHAPLMCELSTGFLHYEAGGKRWYLSVHGGFLEVAENKVRVLANKAERAEEIDVERARADLQRAQERLTNPSSGVDPAIALNDVRSAEARLAAAEHK